MGILITGYHGTTKVIANLVTMAQNGKRHLKMSNNRYDWLGAGIYFWQDAPERARQWATRKYGDQGAVLRAEIDLGLCLDLIDTNGSQETLAQAYSSLSQIYNRQGRPLPAQTAQRHDLDRAVINHSVRWLDRRGAHIDTVRAAFEEGDALYPQSALRYYSHVQIAVRAYEAIITLAIV